MKKWLLVLGWLLFLGAVSYIYVGAQEQEEVTDPLEKINFKQGIAPKFRPYLNKFIEEGKKRGYDYTEEVNRNIKTIVYTPYVEYPTFGLAMHDRKTIAMAEFVESDWVMARFIIYHEIAHMVVGAGKGHSCDSCMEIMSSTTPPTFAYYMGDYWDKRLDYLYNWIELKKNEKLRPVETDNP